MLLTGYCALTLLAFSLSVLTERLGKSRTLILILLSGIFIACAWRDVGIDRVVYQAMWDGSEMRVERSFGLMADLASRYTSDAVGVYIIYAIIGVIIKMGVIVSMGQCAFFAVLVYVSNFFLLHEMIQIRAGIASGCLLVALAVPTDWPLCRRQVCLLLLAVVGTFFHTSGAVILLLLLMGPRRVDKGLWLLLIMISFVLLCCGVSISSILEVVDIPAIQERLLKYLDAMGDGLEINVNRYSIIHCVRAIFSCASIWYWERLSQHGRCMPIVIKTYVLAVVSFWLLADIPAVAMRISQMLSIGEILLVPAFVVTWRGWVGKLIGYGMVCINLGFYSIRLLL